LAECKGTKKYGFEASLSGKVRTLLARAGGLARRPPLYRKQSSDADIAK